MPSIRAATADTGLDIAAQQIGFLQPIFVGGFGDNQSYVQLLETPDVIAGFQAVAYPEVGIVRFVEPVVGEVGKEAIWAFLFPEEPPLVLGWHAFRDALAARLEDLPLAERPLLRFDIVQALELDDLKPKTFAQAYARYAASSELAAVRWRNRSIVEPALRRAIEDMEVEPSGEYHLRAFQRGALLSVQVEGWRSQMLADAVEIAYRELQERYSAILPRDLDILVESVVRRVTPTARQPSDLTIFLVGDLARERFQLPFDDRLSIEVVAADHAGRHLRDMKQSPVNIILGLQRDWQSLVTRAVELSELNPLIVVVGNSAVAVMRHLELQSAAKYPTVSVIATRLTPPYPEVASALRPLIDLLVASGPLPSPGAMHEILPAMHSVLLRHSALPRRDPRQIACVLGTRALRSGVKPGARAILVADPRSDHRVYWPEIFKPLFPVELREGGINPSKRTTEIALLVEREDRSWGPLEEMQRVGARALLEMRGWQVTPQGSHLELRTPRGDRAFNALIIDGRDDVPLDDQTGFAAALGRASVVVIHLNPRREALLIGNRGHRLHIALSDIALMEPDAPWIWPVLKRQLFSLARPPTLAALRLAASLAGEAIRMQRFDMLDGRLPPDQLIRILDLSDCERYLDFMPNGLAGGVARIRIRRPIDDEAQEAHDTILRLEIDVDGPTLLIDGGGL